MRNRPQLSRTRRGPRIAARSRSASPVQLLNSGRVDFRFSLGMDGGKSNLGNSAKVCALVAMSPLLPFDVLLGISLLHDQHENSDLMYKAIIEIFSELGLDLRQIANIVADNASVNPATVDKLNEYMRGKLGPKTAPIPFVRCLPHSLALVFVALLLPFEKAFNMSTHLKQLRGYITAGGGSSRRALLAEYALTLSGIDFADTRWATLIAAIRYMMTDQTQDELDRADARLKELAAKGDAEAARAVALGPLRCAGGWRCRGLFGARSSSWRCLCEA